MASIIKISPGSKFMCQSKCQLLCILIYPCVHVTVTLCSYCCFAPCLLLGPPSHMREDKIYLGFSSPSNIIKFVAHLRF
jgi:hypothetical protein